MDQKNYFFSCSMDDIRDYVITKLDFLSLRRIVCGLVTEECPRVHMWLRVLPHLGFSK